MTFEAQYERMVKRQLGGLLQDYINYSSEDFDLIEKNKQTDNMTQCLDEFQRLKTKVPPSTSLKILSVSEMPACITKDYF
jgi:hypothetical protein